MSGCHHGSSADEMCGLCYGEYAENEREVYARAQAEQYDRDMEAAYAEHAMRQELESLRADLAASWAQVEALTKALEATSKTIRNNLTCWCERCGGGCSYCYSLGLSDAALAPKPTKEET